MTTITDTTILNWLPFDETGGEVWRLALANSENQNWNVTDPANITTTLAMAGAARHGNSSSLFASPAHLGLATGLLLSLLFNSRIWTAKANKEVFGSKKLFGAPKPYQWILHLTPSSSFTFASTKTFILPYLYFLPLLAMILLLPILSVLMGFLLPFAIYRFAIQMYVRYRSDTHSRKNLFSGADAVWKFNESYESYSVINALIILEGEPQIDKLRQILTTRLGTIPKLRMRHNFTFGYATWYEDKEMDLGSLVQWIPGFSSYSSSKSSKTETNETNPHNSEYLSYTKWNRNNLSKIVENLCNRPLPKDHTVGWEALVGKSMLWEEIDDDLNSGSAKDKGNRKSVADVAIGQTVFPILFRIHHSVGDGASLLQLLMTALIDGDTFTSLPSKNNQHPIHPTSISRPLTLNVDPIEVDQSERGISNIDFTNMSPKISKLLSHSMMSESEKRTSNTGCNYINHSKENLDGKSEISNYGSEARFQNTTGKNSFDSKIDKESSFLYGRRLSGKKTILWDSTSVSVEEIKKIRGATGVKFTEILLSAVSAALSNYWEARESGQLNDVTNVNRKFHGRMKDGLSNYKNSDLGKKSEDDRDQLTDVPEDKEKECPNEEYALRMEHDRKGTPPSSVKLVLPAILGSLFQKQKNLTLKDTSELENLFSVAVMSLPVGKSGVCPLKRLSQVSEASGYMMPLRKDSIIDCGIKMKSEISQVAENTKEMNKYVPITHQQLGNEDSSTKLLNLDTTSQEMTHKHSTSQENLKIAFITPGEPEVLTYYCTREPEIQVKLTQEPDATFNRSAHVQYHRYSDSAKVILQEKEPYHCPTTIFFTQNLNINISYDTTNKQSARVQDACTGASSFNITKNENCKPKCFTVKHPDASTPKKNDIQANNKEEISNITLEPVKNHEVSKSTAAPATPINFPSSPTIQHLLTRWLALDIVATVLPSVFAAPMMKIAANGVAVVMSNLPGPPKKLHSILGGYALKDIVFWAPHRGYTGLGITILSYDGLLHVGVMADDAVIPTQEGAKLIMNTILDELHSLRAAVSSSY